MPPNISFNFTPITPDLVYINTANNIKIKVKKKLINTLKVMKESDLKQCLWQEKKTEIFI